MIILILLCITAVVSAKKAPPYDLKEGSQYFEDFIDTYNKVYNSDEEKAKRYEIFLKNLEEINQLNAKYEYTEYSVNQFSDLTLQEFQEQHKSLDAPAGYLGSCASVGLGMINKYKGLRAPLHNNISMPRDFDWREKNVVTRVKNQGNCRSGWAFSVIANLESAYALYSGNLVELSEQQLLDCDTLDFGCYGGNPELAVEYLVRDGAMTSKSYPYAGTAQSCRYQKSNVAVRVKDCLSVENDGEDHLRTMLYMLGPLSVGVASSPLQHYSSGVLAGDSCLQDLTIDHFALLVGYGDDYDSGLPYWLLKNSWGESWGEKGYFKIQNGVNCLGITGMQPVTADMYGLIY